MCFCFIIDNISSFFSSVTPNPSFLSDVAAFEAAVIALLVPLSIEIISKISERYNSDVITRNFEGNFWNKYLPPLLLINIFIAIALRFLVDESSSSILWKYAAWIVLLFLLFIAFGIYFVIHRIKIFVSDPKAVIDQLYKDVEESLE